MCFAWRMRITKREHACLVLENDSHSLVIDPGSFGPVLPELHGVVGIVITHEHADHWTAEQLESILTHNPDARLFSTAVTATQVARSGVAAAVEPVQPGETIELPGFRLEFFGGRHEIIHSSIPQINNVAVLVNDTLYHPGDSYALPRRPVPLLAAPASAPWLKIGEAMDFVLAVAPERCIQIHELVNSDLGNGMAEARLRWATEQAGGTFRWLSVGESLDA